MPANFSGYVDPETIIKQQKKRIAELERDKELLIRACELSGQQRDKLVAAIQMSLVSDIYYGEDGDTILRNSLAALCAKESSSK